MRKCLSRSEKSIGSISMKWFKWCWWRFVLMRIKTSRIKGTKSMTKIISTWNSFQIKSMFIENEILFRFTWKWKITRSNESRRNSTQWTSSSIIPINFHSLKSMKKKMMMMNFSPLRMTLTIWRHFNKQSKQNKWSQLFWIPNRFLLWRIFSKQIEHLKFSSEGILEWGFSIIKLKMNWGKNKK